jgi:serine/threonine protein kinase/Tol biopolymer transport system component
MNVASGPRFRILRPHTNGGLGEVFVARDEELEREVALKKIQEQHADCPESRSRFLREAVITGSLEHPGIVPVYGFGQYIDGRPFFAMRFIRGESLKQASDRFHQRTRQKQESTRVLELRQLLGRLIAVCNAVAYAHSRGILHRDLKPDNIMLGNYGETLVVDWGLAKAFDGHETAIRQVWPRSSEALPADADRPAPPAPAADSELTQMGRTLGTLQYMSPEQAAGFLDQLTPASDIYSLGATLYYVLTGKGPFAGTDGDLIPLLVQGGDFPRPRQINPQVPAALEAICLKAMSRRPEDRYASARDLADDLEHWLADEAVLAYPEPWPARLGQWARRRKWLVVLLGAAVAVALTVAIASVLLAAVDERRLWEQTRADRMQEFAAERTRLETLARRYLYFSRINLADRAWQEAHVGRMLSLLQEERAAQEDVLGFEWHYLWRLQHSSLFTLEAHSHPVVAVGFSLDGKYVATGSDRSIILWSAKTGQRIRAFKGHEGSVTSLAFSPDCQFLASASFDGTIKIWELASQQLIVRVPRVSFRGHENMINSLSFTQDGRRLASAGHDRIVRIWNVSLSGAAPALTALSTLSGHSSSINAVSFSPNGNFLASASGETSDVFRPGEVKIWDLPDCRELLSLGEHTATVTSLAYHPDGKLLATASCDRTIRIWDVSPDRGSRTSLVTLQGHGKTVRSVAFSPDGKQLASASEDQTIKVWDVARHLELLTLRGHTQEVSLSAPWVTDSSAARTIIRPASGTPGPVKRPRRSKDTGWM